MEKVIWSDDLCIGVEAIDTQHKRLFDIRNRLAECSASDDPAQVEQSHLILSELFEYSREHFMSEEDFMQSVGFPGLGAQLDEHGKFIDKIYDLSVAASKGVPIRAEGVDFLTRWLIGHICNSDIQIRYFLEGRGS